MLLSFQSELYIILARNCKYSLSYHINVIKPTNKRITKEKGIKYFQQNAISWSTLNLGRVHLSHIWTRTKNNPLDANQKNCSTGTNHVQPNVFPKYPNGDWYPPKNIIATIAETANILVYSAIKNIANFIPEYSVW